MLAGNPRHGLIFPIRPQMTILFGSSCGLDPQGSQAENDGSITKHGPERVGQTSLDAGALSRCQSGASNAESIESCAARRVQRAG